jgi:hypothetical protein
MPATFRDPRGGASTLQSWGSADGIGPAKVHQPLEILESMLRRRRPDGAPSLWPDLDETDWQVSGAQPFLAIGVEEAQEVKNHVGQCAAPCLTQ